MVRARISEHEIGSRLNEELVKAEGKLLRQRPEPRAREFLSVHRHNPRLFIEFYRLARKVKFGRKRRLPRGQRGWSARQIYNDLREKTPTRLAGVFKLNNNWSPYLARLVMLYDPRFEGFFETREYGGRVHEAA